MSLSKMPPPSLDLDRKMLELRKQNAMRDERSAHDEISELRSMSKEMDEMSQQLQMRLSSLLAELASHKVHRSACHREYSSQNSDEATRQGAFLVSYRDISAMITSAFQDILKEKLSDVGFVEQLSVPRVGSRPEFCNVVYTSDVDESAEWKIFDPRETIELTFGALLDDVCRYWGLDHDAMSLVDRIGAVWPQEAFVWDEIPAAEISGSDRRAVWVRRLPHVGSLGSIHLDYSQDEME